MKRSHLVDLFLSSAWYLHGPVYDRLSNLLHAHLTGGKAEWRLAMDDGDAEPAPPINENAVDYLQDGIAVIDVRGVLSMHADEINGECQPRGRSYEMIIGQVQAAAADPAVQSIVLRMETPGGHAPGCQETYDAIRAADAIKPVYAFLTGYCFSAGMYIASACRGIVAASRTLEMGSIGTIWATWDTSAAAEAEGMKRVVVRAGAYKALMQDGEPITSTAIAEEQRIVDAFGAAFHDAVRAGRGLTDAQAEATLNGRTWMAGDAIALGLVDEIATFTDFKAAIAGPEQAVFGFKKKTPAAASAAASTTPPTSAGTEQESVMDTKTLAALSALSNAHPTHAVGLIAEAAKSGASEDSLKAYVDRAEKDAQAKAAHDKAVSDLAAEKARADAAEAKVAAEKKRADDADAKAAAAETARAEMQAKHDKVLGLKPQHKNPQPGNPTATSLKTPMSATEFEALGAIEKAKVLEAVAAKTAELAFDPSATAPTTTQA